MYTCLNSIIFSVCMLYVCQSYGQKIANEQCEKYVKELENIQKENGVPRRLKRIIGGTKAKPSEFPFMAALGYIANDNIRWICGGTLVSEKFVLTSAACASFRPEIPIKFMRLGTTNVTVPIGQHPAQDITVKKLHVHPQFNRKQGLTNDIALVELETNVNFSSSVFPACLQTDSRSINVLVNVIGWGKTEHSGEGISDLLKVKLSITSPEECRKAYPADSFSSKKGIESDTQICAKSPDRDTPRGSCVGDTGGPLHIQNGNKHIVVGVASFGKACGIARSIGVYTKVSAFVLWLESIVWK